MFRRNGEITLRSVQCQDYGWDGERRRESACCYDCTFSSVNSYFTSVSSVTNLKVMNFALLFAYTRSIALEATRSLIFRQMWSTVRGNS